MAEHSRAREEYVKAIYALTGGGDGPVTTSALAARLGVTAGSVSAMLKKLAEAGLVEHRSYHGVTLAPAGQRTAATLNRRHALLEAFLVRELGMPAEHVQATAARLEHHLSDELETLIAAKLTRAQTEAVTVVTTPSSAYHRPVLVAG